MSGLRVWCSSVESVSAAGFAVPATSDILISEDFKDFAATPIRRSGAGRGFDQRARPFQPTFGSSMRPSMYLAMAWNGCARIVLYDNLRSAVLERQGDAIRFELLGRPATAFGRQDGDAARSTGAINSRPLWFR
jgi:hypothetical protein